MVSANSTRTQNLSLYFVLLKRCKIPLSDTNMHDNNCSVKSNILKSSLEIMVWIFFSSPFISYISLGLHPKP